jgi:hypothetical protein
MYRMEELRRTVTMDEIGHGREALKPKPKKRAKDAAGVGEAAAT